MLFFLFLLLCFCCFRYHCDQLLPALELLLFLFAAGLSLFVLFGSLSSSPFDQDLIGCVCRFFPPYRHGILCWSSRLWPGCGRLLCRERDLSCTGLSLLLQGRDFLMAILGVCLAWGWLREAGIFSLAWGALLRISEATSATRRHLVMPEDTMWMQSFILVCIDQPKTRGRAAKHQAAKLEPSDLVELVTLAFGKLDKRQRIWPYTNQTLRRRLDSVLSRLGISKSDERSRSLDLGSFKPGGATFLLQASEDSELVRRRGRWASHKVMEIYLQEVASSTFVSDLSPLCKDKVLYMARCYPYMLQKAKEWSKSQVPCSCWYHLWP